MCKCRAEILCDHSSKQIFNKSFQIDVSEHRISPSTHHNSQIFNFNFNSQIFNFTTHVHLLMGSPQF